MYSLQVYNLNSDEIKIVLTQTHIRVEIPEGCVLVDMSLNKLPSEQEIAKEQCFVVIQKRDRTRLRKVSGWDRGTELINSCVARFLISVVERKSQQQEYVGWEDF